MMDERVQGPAQLDAHASDFLGPNFVEVDINSTSNRRAREMQVGLEVW